MAFNYFDLQQSFSLLAIPRPQKPIKTDVPDGTRFYEHLDEGDYEPFSEVVSKLFAAFKFLPKWDQMAYEYGDPRTVNDILELAEYIDALGIDSFEDFEFPEGFSKQAAPSTSSGLYFGYGYGTRFSNLTYRANASTWQFMDGIDLSQDTVVTDIAKYFDWEAIQDIGGEASYYEIAENGLDSFTTEATEAFYLMCSMLESRSRVFNTWQDLIGSVTGLGNHESIIAHIDEWIGMDVDPHNLTILKMLFGMQSDFINSVDAYINCSTYWGDSFEVIDPSDPRYSLAGFGADLGSKVDDYIKGLEAGSEQYNPAVRLKAMWFKTGDYADLPGSAANGGCYWDVVDGLKTREIIMDETIEPSTNWVKYFWEKIKEAEDQEIIRIVVARSHNRMEEAEYKREKVDYETKVDDAKMEEAAKIRAEAKKRAARTAGNKKSIQRIQQRSKMARAIGKKRTSRNSANVTRAPHVARPSNNASAAPRTANKSLVSELVKNHITSVSGVPKNKAGSNGNKKKNPKSGEVI